MNKVNDRRILRKYRGQHISSMFGIEGVVVGINYGSSHDYENNYVTFVLKVEDNPLAWNVDLRCDDNVYIRNIDYNKSARYMHALCSLKDLPC
mgnify:FL=1